MLTHCVTAARKSHFHGIAATPRRTLPESKIWGGRNKADATLRELEAQMRGVQMRLDLAKRPNGEERGLNLSPGYYPRLRKQIQLHVARNSVMNTAGSERAFRVLKIFDSLKALTTY